MSGEVTLRNNVPPSSSDADASKIESEIVFYHDDPEEDGYGIDGEPLPLSSDVGGDGLFRSGDSSEKDKRRTKKSTWAIYMSIALVMLLVVVALFTSKSSMQDSSSLSGGGKYHKPIYNVHHEGEEENGDEIVLPSSSPKDEDAQVVVDAAADAVEEEVHELSEEAVEWLNSEVYLRDGIMYELVATLPHNPLSFTQGLAFFNGTLYESIGQTKGESVIHVLDASTGDLLKTYELSNRDTLIRDIEVGSTKTNPMLQIWSQNEISDKNSSEVYTVPYMKAYKNNNRSGKALFKTTGVGITRDDSFKNLMDGFYRTDRSAFLTKGMHKQILVKRKTGAACRNLGQMTFWRGRLLILIDSSDILLVVNPDTGLVEKEYDLGSLYERTLRWDHGAGKLSAVTVSPDGLLYISGENWGKIYVIKLLSKKPKSTSSPTATPVIPPTATPIITDNINSNSNSNIPTSGGGNEP